MKYSKIVLYIWLFTGFLLPVMAFTEQEKNAYFNELTARRRKPFLLRDEGIKAEDRGEDRKAIIYYRNALKDSSDMALEDELCQRLAKSYMRLRLPVKAASYSARVQNPQLRFLLQGDIAFLTGKYNMAVNQYEQYLRNFDSSQVFCVRLNMAEALFQDGRINDALTIYMWLYRETAIAKETFLQAKACYGAGWCYLKLNDKSNALSWFRRALTVSGDAQLSERIVVQTKLLEDFFADIDFNLAYTYEQSGKRDLAIAGYEHLINDYPASAYFVKGAFRLAQLYVDTGSVDKAKDLYNRIITSAVPEAKIAREKLDKLKLR